MNRWLGAGMVVMFLGGCAWFGQARKDYQLGRSTPVAVGEVSPHDAAVNLVAPIQPFLPTPLQPVAGLAIAALTILGTWRRGRALRKGQPATANPITGEWGQRLGLETVVQQVSNVAQGLFEVGPQNSGLKRGWKVFVTIGLALLSASLAVPAVRVLVVQHPDIIGLLATLSAIIAGVEKELSKVLPPTPPTP